MHFFALSEFIDVNVTDFRWLEWKRSSAVGWLGSMFGIYCLERLFTWKYFSIKSQLLLKMFLFIFSEFFRGPDEIVLVASCICMFDTHAVKGQCQQHVSVRNSLANKCCKVRARTIQPSVAFSTIPSDSFDRIWIYINGIKYCPAFPLANMITVWVLDRLHLQ